jgi:hypothetical protein
VILHYSKDYNNYTNCPWYLVLLMESFNLSGFSYNRSPSPDSYPELPNTKLSTTPRCSVHTVFQNPLSLSSSPPHYWSPATCIQDTNKTIPTNGPTEIHKTGTFRHSVAGGDDVKLHNHLSYCFLTQLASMKGFVNFPWSRILFEKIMLARMAKKFCVFMSPKSFITFFTRICHTA